MVYQSPVAGNWQTTPLVVDGVMYITQRLNDVVALDADDRPRVLDLSPHAGPGSHRLLRRQQPRASRFSATRCSWARSTRS